MLSGHKGFIKKNAIRFFFSVFAYTTYTYWISYFTPLGFHTVLISLLTVLLLNFTYKAGLFNTIIKTFLILIAVSIIETIISICGLVITNKPINELLQDDIYIFICSVISKAFEFIFLFIISRNSYILSWLNTNTPSRSKYKSVLVLIATAIAFLISTNIYLTSSLEKAFILNIFTFIIYLFLILAMISAFREGSKLELLQYANEMQKENIKQLIDFNEMVAKERHEYKNHLNTIFGLCTLNKPDTTERIKHYINNYANNSSTKNISVDSGIDLVDAIINVKYNNGLRKGIELKANFEEPLLSADIKEDIAVTVFSNIIDNAFEAMNNIVKDDKYVLVSTYIENDSYIISISNNGPMISEADKTKIFSAGYSTKDNPSKTRGFGLCIVQNEINRCNGCIEINSTPEITEFLISFNLKQVQAAG